MRKLTLSIAVVLGLFAVVSAQPSGSGSGSAVTPTVVDTGSGSGSAVAQPPVVPSTDSAIPPAPEKALSDQLKDVQQAYKDLKSSSPEEKDLAIAAFIAILMNLLLTGVKRVMKLTSKGKKWLPFVALGLGLVIAIVQKFALGGGWVQALIYGGAGPGAVIVQEMLNFFKKSEPTPPAPTPPEPTPTPA